MKKITYFFAPARPPASACCATSIAASAYVAPAACKPLTLVFSKPASVVSSCTICVQLPVSDCLELLIRQPSAPVAVPIWLAYFTRATFTLLLSSSIVSLVLAVSSRKEFTAVFKALIFDGEPLPPKSSFMEPDTSSTKAMSIGVVSVVEVEASLPVTSSLSV